MVAYSFKKRFIEPIAVGLGERRMHHIHPKRQTIRADRKRHARPGEELQLYCGMRTKGCFLIGRAQCMSVAGITLWFGVPAVSIDGRPPIEIDGALDAFAQQDGFKDWPTLSAFWREEHDALTKFSGVIIKWEPLS